MNLNSHFGQVVKHLREREGWSQERLAENADLNRSYIGEVERGIATPSLITVAKLAGAFGVPPSALLARCEQAASHRS